MDSMHNLYVPSVVDAAKNMKDAIYLWQQVPHSDASGHF